MMVTKFHIVDYDKLPRRGKETLDGTKLKPCEECGGRCYVFYDEDRHYRVECEDCGNEVEFEHSSMDGAIYHFNSLKHETFECERCPLGWEERGYEGECYDCGCFVNDDPEWCVKPYAARMKKSREFELGY